MERTIKKIAFATPQAPKLTRVAAYARVSSGKDAMLHSLSAQVSYYNDLIQHHPGWIFCGVYADEALTGTKADRETFTRLLQDCKAGKVDMVITKSISRFARNTVTLLKTIRELKQIGVDVYFEEQNIHSISSDGELMLTILASYAQEESRSISENVTWGQRKRFADGKVSMSYRQFLGYRKGADGLPEIVPEEAELVRWIYRTFMQGKTPHGIAKMLTAEHIPTPAGKEKWQSSTVESILKNEKYRGDARLQKKFTVDFLQKKMKVNEGEVPQYYVENSHPAIIEPDEWDLVQAEFSRRKELGGRYSSAGIFSTMLICGDCGTPYGAKVWHSTDKYRRTVWQCNHKFKGEHRCTTPHLYEKDIKEMFLRAFSKLMADRVHILEDIRLVQATLCDCTELDAQQIALEEEMEIVSDLIRRCIAENTAKVQNQTAFMEKYERHTGRYEKMKQKYTAIEAERQRRKEQYDHIAAFSKMLTEQAELPIDFSENLWLAAVDHATINANETVTFTFKDGTEITEQM